VVDVPEDSTLDELNVVVLIVVRVSVLVLGPSLVDDEITSVTVVQGVEIDALEEVMLDVSVDEVITIDNDASTEDVVSIEDVASVEDVDSTEEDDIVTVVQGVEDATLEELTSDAVVLENVTIEEVELVVGMVVIVSEVNSVVVVHGVVVLEATLASTLEEVQGVLDACVAQHEVVQGGGGVGAQVGQLMIL